MAVFAENATHHVCLVKIDAPPTGFDRSTSAD
jgi:hypothetical protein